MLIFKKNSLLKVFCLFLCFLFAPITKADSRFAKVVLLGKIGSGKTTLHTLLKFADRHAPVSWEPKKEFNMFPKHTVNISVQTKTDYNESKLLNYDNKVDDPYAPHAFDNFDPYSSWQTDYLLNFNIDIPNVKEEAKISYLVYDTTAEQRHEKFIDEFCNNAHAIFLCVNAKDFIDRQNGKLYFQESEDFYKLLRKIPKIAPKSKVIIFLTQLGNIKDASNELKDQVKNFIKNIKDKDEFKDYVHSSFDFTLDYSDPDAIDAFKQSHSYYSFVRNKYTKMFIANLYHPTDDLDININRYNVYNYFKKGIKGIDNPFEPQLNGLLASLIVEHGIDYFPKTPEGFSSFIIKEEKKYVETGTVDNNDCTGSKSTRTRTKNEYKLKVLKNKD